MNNELRNHITDLIETFLAGGLSDEEEAVFEAHVRDCASCATALSSAQEFNGSIISLLSDARPDFGLEDRVLTGFRTMHNAPLR